MVCSRSVVVGFRCMNTHAQGEKPTGPLCTLVTTDWQSRASSQMPRYWLTSALLLGNSLCLASTAANQWVGASNSGGGGGAGVWGE